MRKFLLRSIVFVAVCAFFAFIAWCSGYNFDTRSLGVSYNVFAAISCAFLIALLCIE